MMIKVAAVAEDDQEVTGTIEELPTPPIPASSSSRGGGTSKWKPFRFSNLERVHKSHVHVIRNLEWLLPNVRVASDVSESVRARLGELLNEKVSMMVDAVRVASASELRHLTSDPALFGVLAPLPSKPRGLVEVELSLAHTALTLLLGGTGDAVAHRPLTDIEEGVLTFVLIEVLKAMAPGLSPELPKLRLTQLCRSVDEAAQVLGEDAHVGLVQLKVVIGGQSGAIRLYLPEAMLDATPPGAHTETFRERAAADALANLERLSSIETFARAEIGQVAISIADLRQLRERDVVLVDQLSARPDRGENGTTIVKVGRGQAAYMKADLSLEDGQYKATITALESGPPPQPTANHDEGDVDGAQPDAEASADDDASGALEAGADGEDGDQPSEQPSDRDGESADDEDADARSDDHGQEADDDESGALNDDDDETGADQGSEPMENAEGAELLNDLPLQIAVEIARVPMSAQDVVALKVGHVIDLNRGAGEPLELSVNGKLIGQGELVEIEGNLGVRILSLVGA